MTGATRTWLWWRKFIELVTGATVQKPVGDRQGRGGVDDAQRAGPFCLGVDGREIRQSRVPKW